MFAKARLPIAAMLLVWGFGAPPSLAASRDFVWTLEPGNAAVSLAINAIGFATVRGEFRQFRGQLKLDLERPANSRASLTIDARSVDMGSALYNNAMRGPNLLKVAQFPEIRFVSRNVERVDESTLRMVGDLTLIGQSRPLTVEIKVPSGEQRASARMPITFSADVDRLSYGINFGYPLVSKTIEIGIVNKLAE